MPSGFTREATDNHSDVSIQMFRFEKELRESQWRGGENFFDGESKQPRSSFYRYLDTDKDKGKHDDFCFVCGSTMELFGCQTCENCYHAECMSPTLEPSEVPNFWFCPHCVDREWHIPPMPSPSSYFTPISPPIPAPQSHGAKNDTQVKRHSTDVRRQPDPVPSLSKHQAVSDKDPEGGKRDRTVENSGKSTGKDQSIAVRFSAPDNHVYSGKSHRPKKSSSPPRKKSKYSAFSSEVDKALSVIHSELEKAGQVGKSEGHLRDKIKDLELRMRVKDNELVLASRELAQSRKNLAAEHCQSERLQSENTQYKEEVMKLRGALEAKESELQDWRAKLRSMIGNDLS